MTPGLGAEVRAFCPRDERVVDAEVVEVREDEGETFVQCPACSYVFEVDP